MNRIIPRIGSAIVTGAVFLFAVCLIVNFPFGAYFVCMFLPIEWVAQNENGKTGRCGLSCHSLL